MSKDVGFRKRNSVARAFVEYYRESKVAFPAHCSEGVYERRLQSAYPFHPELFDRLYNDWSTLVRFQRTRGVLRLMAAVIHALWEQGDMNPLIMPCHIPMSRQDVKSELTRYLPDRWSPVIDADIDGTGATPIRVDAGERRLGRYSAARRVARAIYLGSAPKQGASQPGLDEQRIRLGVAAPGEPTAVFDDVLRRLASKSTYLYQEGTQYWYSTHATVARLATDRAQSMSPSGVLKELRRWLREDVRKSGDFGRVHVLPSGSFEIPDEMGARLVILGVDHLYTRGPGNAAERAAENNLTTRGNAARIYRNTLLFLAADSGRWQDLDEAIRLLLALQSILDESDQLNIDPQQVRQARVRHGKAEESVQTRLAEAFQWLVIPVQSEPTSSVEYEAHRLTGTGSLPERAATKLKGEELLVPVLAPSRLRMELDQVPLWDAHVSLAELASQFSQYLYLPRLCSTRVLADAIKRGIGLINWVQDSFAYADEYGEGIGAYRGLTAITGPTLDPEHLTGLLVKPEVAQKHFERVKTKTKTDHGNDGKTDDVNGGHEEDESRHVVKRFFGSARKDSARIGSWAAEIADDILGHLAGVEGNELSVTLEIHVTAAGGISDEIRSIVEENAATLGFTTVEFEVEEE